MCLTKAIESVFNFDFKASADHIDKKSIYAPKRLVNTIEFPNKYGVICKNKEYKAIPKKIRNPIKKTKKENFSKSSKTSGLKV
jgi:hypothetical protein